MGDSLSSFILSCKVKVSKDGKIDWKKLDLLSLLFGSPLDAHEKS